MCNSMSNKLIKQSQETKFYLINNTLTGFMGDASRKQVTEFVKDKKVIFKQLCETNNIAVVEEDYNKTVMEEIKDKGLIAERLTAEEFYMYRTTVNLGEDLEKLWEK